MTAREIVLISARFFVRNPRILLPPLFAYLIIGFLGTLGVIALIQIGNLEYPLAPAIFAGIVLALYAFSVFAFFLLTLSESACIAYVRDKLKMSTSSLRKSAQEAIKRSPRFLKFSGLLTLALLILGLALQGVDPRGVAIVRGLVVIGMLSLCMIVPVMMNENRSPLESVRRSADLFLDHWNWLMLGSVVWGILQFLVTIGPIMWLIVLVYRRFNQVFIDTLHNQPRSFDWGPVIITLAVTIGLQFMMNLLGMAWGSVLHAVTYHYAVDAPQAQTIQMPLRTLAPKVFDPQAGTLSVVSHQRPGLCTDNEAPHPNKTKDR